MARLSRLKLEGHECWYHVYSKITGDKDSFPLHDESSSRKLIDIIQHFSKGYFCEVAAFCVMGNHYHIVVRFDEPRPLEMKELGTRAKYFYPSRESQKVLKRWTSRNWRKFERRLFDVSEFMRNVQMAYARWYNATHNRKGRFWADRFKSTILATPESVIDCMLYVELNPVRAQQVSRPEDWKGSSFCLRDMGKDSWLLPLRDILHTDEADDKVLRKYRMRLYYRGAVPTKDRQARIPKEVLDIEECRGFKQEGVYMKRMRYFTDGLVIGSENNIREWIGYLRESGRYLRRTNPVMQENAVHTIREQRCNFV